MTEETFDPQKRPDCITIANVRLDHRSRHKMTRIFRALQEVYCSPEVRDSMLDSIARDLEGRPDAGGPHEGMCYWEIAVITAVHLGCGYDSDQLADLAQNHRLLREMMGRDEWDPERDARKFDDRCIEGNLKLLSAETLELIGAAVGPKRRRRTRPASVDSA